MNIQETAAILAMISTFDRRTLTPNDAKAWDLALDGQLTYDDAKAAVVKHYASSTEWLMPAHLNRLGKAIRKDRAERTFSCGVPGCGCAPLPPEIQRANTRALEQSLSGAFRRIQ